tara:strand:- start:368 stop:1060 length:693 start_codon:yes stop_codon:yes gene_type:complete
MIKLFQFKLCPFSRRVRLTLEEYNISFVTIDEIIWNERKEFLAINPARSLPVLIDEADNIIINNYAIIEYIEEKYSHTTNVASLISGNLSSKAEIRRLVDWYDNKFYNEVSKIILRELIDKYYMKNRINDKSPNMELLRIAHENSIYHLEYLSHLISSRSWIAGEVISQADIAAASHISCLDYLNKIDWDKWLEIKNWYARIKSRPSFSPILEDRIAGFQPPSHYSNPDF